MRAVLCDHAADLLLCKLTFEQIFDVCAELIDHSSLLIKLNEVSIMDIFLIQRSLNPL